MSVLGAYFLIPRLPGHSTPQCYKKEKSSGTSKQHSVFFQAKNLKKKPLHLNQSHYFKHSQKHPHNGHCVHNHFSINDFLLNNQNKALKATCIDLLLPQKQSPAGDYMSMNE